MKTRCLLILLLWVIGAARRSAAAPADIPHIILVLADDMGYSDLGGYGSEIATLAWSMSF